jgi:hypothetical protein
MTKSLKGILQFGAFLSSKPSTHVGSIQSFVSCLRSMVLSWQILDYVWVTCDVCRMMVKTLCIHIPMTMMHDYSLLKCKFCHFPPFFVNNYSGWIYYVVHKFQFMWRAMIYIGVHNILLKMESVGGLLKRLKGWSQRRWIPCVVTLALGSRPQQRFA